MICAVKPHGWRGRPQRSGGPRLRAREPLLFVVKVQVQQFVPRETADLLVYDESRIVFFRAKIPALKAAMGDRDKAFFWATFDLDRLKIGVSTEEAPWQEW